MDMKKELFYYFYIDSDEYYEVYKLHLECLKGYINVFNNVNIILSLDNINNTYYIDLWKDRIINYLQYNNVINFIIVQNDPKYREGIHFFNLIFSKLSDFDSLIYWGHGKRDFIYDKNIIYDWICGMHYLNSLNINEIENILTSYNNQYCLHGPFIEYYNMMYNSLLYSGAMYWIYPKKLLDLFEEQYDMTKEYYLEILYYDNSIKSDNNIIYSIAENWQNFFLTIKNMYNYQISPIKNIHITNGNIFYSSHDPYMHTLDNIKSYFDESLFNDMIDYCNNIQSTIIDAKEEESTNRT